MSEYVKLKTARKIVCSACKEYAPPGDCPEDCAWMRRLKKNAADVAPVVEAEYQTRRADLLHEQLKRVFDMYVRAELRAQKQEGDSRADDD